jgi:hypothetical protein
MQYHPLPVKNDQHEHSSVSLSGSKDAPLVATVTQETDTQETVTDLTVSAGFAAGGEGPPGAVVSVV